ncbi:MAG TPA: glycyl-radical enzyme activating protein [Anaerolineaceae bacterium]|nr:glycyl-radical enzyme activating protein [Anaerolineaceae bacterium]
MQTGIVFDIMHFSTRDGPGIRTTVFLKGCPLHCTWCHNPESQAIKPELMLRPNLCIACETCISICPEGAISRIGDMFVTDRLKCTLCGTCVAACTSEARQIAGREMTVEQVLAEIAKDTAFFDESGGGVTFSGGEALLQRDFLLALLKACKEKGIHTALDTSGFATWPVIDSVRAYVDLFLYDLKSLDDKIHRENTGVSNELILSNLRRLSELGHAIVLRMPLIPGINDSEQAIQAAGELAAGLPHLLGLEILPYHKAGVEKYRRLDREYELAGLIPPAGEQVEWIAKVLREHHLIVNVGG